jgi:hypothetical protein
MATKSPSSKTIKIATGTAAILIAAAMPAPAYQTLKQVPQDEQRGPAGNILVEESVITVVACNDPGENGVQHYIYRYVKRASFRAIRPPDWGKPIGGRDWATFQEAAAAACQASPPPPTTAASVSGEGRPILTDTAHSEKRVALVIGNGGYLSVANLPNPPRDAMAMSQLFKAAGFDEVTVKTDLGVSEMRAELRDFARKAAGADIAAVFYAGHGIEVGGRNYLVPIDAKLEFDTDVEDEAVDLDRILQQLEPVKRLKLVILDACRENPFAPRMKNLGGRSRGIGRGLTPPSREGADTLVAYAAAVGTTAADGAGNHSPFTAALLNNLTRPGLDIRLALGKVRDEVLRATGSQQIPFISGSLGGDTLALAPALATQPSPSTSSPTVNQEQADFEAAMRADTIPALTAFLARYPQSSSTDIVRRERDRLSKLAALPPLQPTGPSPQPSEAAHSPPLLLASFGDWSAYVSEAENGKNCFALAKPRERIPASLKREPGYAIIGTRPNQNVKNEVSFFLGVGVKEAASVSATIDGEAFELFPRGNVAWIKNQAIEPRFVETVRKGSKLTVSISTALGGNSADNYSLSGLSQALDRVATECK